MAKTDSFGRPYYETAEEYNQAHRKAKATGNYGQMQQEKRAYNHTSGRGAKKKYGQISQNATQSTVLFMGVGIAVISVVVITMLTMSLVNNSGNSSDSWYEDEYINYGDGDYEQLGVDDVPLAEGFNTVTYHGVAYTIPMTYEEFVLLDVPLQVYPPSGEELCAGDSETLDLEDEDGRYIGYIRIENETDEDMPRGKCQIKYISFSSEAAFTGDMSFAPDVTLANGLDMTCTYAELEEVMGTATYKYTDEDEGNLYENYIWEYYGEDHSEHFDATFWNGVLSDFSVMVDEY